MLVALVATAAAWRRWGRPWQQRWGATDAEVAAPLPGDDLVAEPAQQVTRAIGIGAPPEAVWPWVVQLGADRGGFYSYDWLENLFGLRIHSADRIVEEWQELAVGDIVAADRAVSGGWVVGHLEPGSTLAMLVADVDTRSPLDRDEQGWEFLWTFAVRPAPDGGSRLLVRERTAFGTPIARALLAPVGLVSFVMTRRMLQGIKGRAEAAAPPDDHRTGSGR